MKESGVEEIVSCGPLRIQRRSGETEFGLGPQLEVLRKSRTKSERLSGGELDHGKDDGALFVVY